MLTDNTQWRTFHYELRSLKRFCFFHSFISGSLKSIQRKWLANCRKSQNLGRYSIDSKARWPTIDRVSYVIKVLQGRHFVIGKKRKESLLLKAVRTTLHNRVLWKIPKLNKFLSYVVCRKTLYILTKWRSSLIQDICNDKSTESERAGTIQIIQPIY